MTTRSANEWRDFWRERGERELAQLLGELSPHAARVATLLGSRAPRTALAAELGRIQGGPPDAALANAIYEWFEHV